MDSIFIFMGHSQNPLTLYDRLHLNFSISWEQQSSYDEDKVTIKVFLVLQAQYYKNIKIK